MTEKYNNKTWNKEFNKNKYNSCNCPNHVISHNNLLSRMKSENENLLNIILFYYIFLRLKFLF